MKSSLVRDLFTDCAEAVAGKESAAFARSFDALARAVTRRIEHHLRATGTSESSLPDLSQDVLIKLHAVLQRGPALDNPEAWLRTVCERTAIDRYRRTKGRKYVSWSEEPVDDDSTSTERELFKKGGVDRHDQPERALDASRTEQRFFEAIAVYAERAEGQAPRGHQVMAWFGVVLGATTAQVLEAIEKRYGRTAKPDTLWQWKRRGGALVKELAGRDEDRARGEMMLRLTEAA